VTVTTPEGANLLPTQYETAHRASWRRLRDHLADGSLALDLDEFAADAALAGSLKLLAHETSLKTSTSLAPECGIDVMSSARNGPETAAVRQPSCRLMCGIAFFR
jgi:hypothetical protein